MHVRTCSCWRWFWPTNIAETSSFKSTSTGIIQVFVLTAAEPCAGVWRRTGTWPQSRVESTSTNFWLLWACKWVWSSAGLCHPFWGELRTCSCTILSLVQHLFVVLAKQLGLVQTYFYAAVLIVSTNYWALCVCVCHHLFSPWCSCDWSETLPSLCLIAPGPPLCLPLV